MQNVKALCVSTVYHTHLLWSTSKRNLFRIKQDRLIKDCEQIQSGLSRKIFSPVISTIVQQETSLHTQFCGFYKNLEIIKTYYKTSLNSRKEIENPHKYIYYRRRNTG